MLCLKLCLGLFTRIWKTCLFNFSKHTQQLGCAVFLHHTTSTSTSTSTFIWLCLHWTQYMDWQHDVVVKYYLVLHWNARSICVKYFVHYAARIFYFRQTSSSFDSCAFYFSALYSSKISYFLHQAYRQFIHCIDLHRSSLHLHWMSRLFFFFLYSFFFLVSTEKRHTVNKL